MSPAKEQAELLKTILVIAKGQLELGVSLENPKATYEIVCNAIALAEEIIDDLSGKISPREKEIITFIVDGYSNAEIAERISVSEKTVKFHITSIFKKLGVRNRGSLISEYYKNELLKTRQEKMVLEEKIQTMLPVGAKVRREQ